MHRQTRQSDRQREKIVTVHRRAFFALKKADFADLECEASAKSVTGTRYE